MSLLNLFPIDHPITTVVDDKLKFYDDVVKHLIPDVVRIMNNGIPIDMDKVKALSKEVDTVVETSNERIQESSIIKEFKKFKYPKLVMEKENEIRSKSRNIDYYLKPFNYTEQQRTIVVNKWLSDNEKDYCCLEKWTITSLKRTNSLIGADFLDRIISKKLTNNELEWASMVVAEHKLAIYEKSIDRKVKEKTTWDSLIQPFKSTSSKQLIELFEWLGIEPISYTDGGSPSWGRENLEIIVDTVDGELKELINLFIDISYAGIIRNNFIKAFHEYTSNGRLYGTITLFGAKSFRLTSKNPNLLNLPSTGSRYAKPIKECLVAPEGYLVAAIDFAALEDRVIANLSKDPNKIGVFTDGLDGHSLACTYYYPDKVRELVGDGDNKEQASKFKALVDEGNKEAKELRQASKPISFKLAYGGYPDSDKGGSITQEIFDNYHNHLYMHITAFRGIVEEYVHTNGYTHLGLGCVMHSDDPSQDIRTLFNANSQFWSILTLISINELHKRLEESKYTHDDIQVIATIYDSIYFIVKKDPEIVKWLNDNIVEIMTVDYLKDIEVHNEADLEVGTNWADLQVIRNGATLEEIKEIKRK